MRVRRERDGRAATVRRCMHRRDDGFAGMVSAGDGEVLVSARALFFSRDEQIVLLTAVASSALQAMGERWSQCERIGQCTNCFLVQGRARIPRLEDLSTLIISPGTKPEGPCHYTWANRVGEVLSSPVHLGRLVTSYTGHDTGMLV